MKQKATGYFVNGAALALLYGVIMALSVAGILTNYYQGILVLVMINIIMAVSLNMVTGFLGQLVLGHAGFMSVGAYTAALFTLYSNLPEWLAFPLGILLGGIVALLFGIVIGIPALRLRGDYLAIITLGFGEIIRVIINSLGFTGGAKGLSGIPNTTNFSNVYLVMVLCVVIMTTFLRSRHGRAVISIRENEIAAEACGVRTTYYKMAAFVLSAFFAGIAGALYAHHVGVLSPAKFDFNYSIEFLVMVVLGGMGSITGSVVSAIALTIVPELLREFSDYRMVIYAVLLIVTMLFKPSGLFGKYEFSLTRLLHRLGALLSKIPLGKAHVPVEDLRIPLEEPPVMKEASGTVTSEEKKEAR